MASSGFYFEKKMHTEMPWQPWQRMLIFDEVERLSQVHWQDVGRHAALKHKDIGDLVLKKNATLPIWQYFGFETGENGVLLLVVYVHAYPLQVAASNYFYFVKL